MLEDLTYTSTFTGGRIPISSALPVEQFVTGKDDYGNEKSRWETLKEAAPYYALPTGYGQIKKTYSGLKMFDDDLPISGSYTDSGSLRFPVEDTLPNRVQAGLFGQWASENAGDYFDNGRKPLNEKQIKEFVEVDLPIRDYWEYREGLSGLKNLNEKGDYIHSLDFPIDKKNFLINNVADREIPIDMSKFSSEYEDFEEFDFAMKYPDKYKVLREQGVSVKEYKDKYEKTTFMHTDDFDWAAKNPEKYTISKAITDDVLEYKNYTRELSAIEGEKDSSGKTISGSKKKNQAEYINNLNLDYGQKIILYRSLFDSAADRKMYENDIKKFIDGRKDLSHQDKVIILETLGISY